MRRLSILLIAVAGLMVGNGCEEDQDEGGVHGVNVDSSRSNDCNSNFETCSITYFVSFKDKADYQDRYYWAELQGLSTDPSDVIGAPIKLYNDGDRKTISVTANYFDANPDFYEVWVYKVNSPSDAGDRRRRTSAGYDFDEHISIGNFGENCSFCCCSNTSRRYWAAISKEAESVIGARSNIETQYGTLCGESVSNSDSATSGAWIGINEELGNSSSAAFIQCGYMRHRGIFSAGSTPDEMMYMEWRTVGMGENSSYFAPFTTEPIEGSTPHYELRVNLENDVIEFRVNGDSLYFVQLNPGDWNGTTGNWVIWSGEIRGWESDMPGTLSDSCSFTDCELERNDGQGFRNASFSKPPDNIGTSDPAEWGIHLWGGGNSFSFWDINPQE
jgi:hypothetical protein